MHNKLDALSHSLKRWRLDEKTFLDIPMEILASYSTFNKQVDLPFLKGVVLELKRLIQEKDRQWKWGLCHGDIFTGNIHRNSDGSLTIFDFDFCGYGWRAYDVAPFLGNFSGGIQAKSIDERKRRLENFLRGYEYGGSLTDNEVDAIYRVFVPFRRIFNMGYLYYVLQNVWGNRLRNEQITQDLRLLKDWINHYW
jgi:Ser/Thr protein kinase RdoA (MazF antagonist)